MCWRYGVSVLSDVFARGFAVFPMFLRGGFARGGEGVRDNQARERHARRDPGGRVTEEQGSGGRELVPPDGWLIRESVGSVGSASSCANSGSS